jgi:hypothetical protein
MNQMKHKNFKWENKIKLRTIKKPDTTGSRHFNLQLIPTQIQI